MNSTISLTKEQAMQFGEVFFDSMHGVSLRTMYERVRGYKELMKEFGVDDCDIDAGLIKWKRRIREKMRKEKERQEERRIIKDYGIDGCVLLVRLGEFNYLGDADDYFMWNEFIERPHSMYDCTGKMFTSWYYIFKRHGIYYAYHRISVDV